MSCDENLLPMTSLGFVFNKKKFFIANVNCKSHNSRSGSSKKWQE